MCTYSMIPDDDDDEGESPGNVPIADQVWNGKSRSKKDMWRNRSQMVYYKHHDTQNSKFLEIIYSEVKAFALRTTHRTTEQGDLYKRCPIYSCFILGGSLELYQHMLKQHSTDEICGWLDKRMLRLYKLRDNVRKPIKPVPTPVRGGSTQYEIGGSNTPAGETSTHERGKSQILPFTQNTANSAASFKDVFYDLTMKDKLGLTLPSRGD
uniref:Uncharacterized protein n=1 Tax=Ciona savignyi TaxID=51511 RepID=H2YBB6_CIOSA